MAQLTWNPGQEGRVVLDDYYRRAFGPAADQVRRYFEILEQARMEYVGKNGYAAGAINLGALFHSGLLDTAEAHLRQAAKAAAKDREVYRQRVEFVRAGFAFTRLVAENSRLMSGYWDNTDETAAARVQENWERMESLCQAHPLAINWRAVRPGTPRMAGLHPDHPNPKLRKQKPNRKPPNDLDLK